MTDIHHQDIHDSFPVHHRKVLGILEGVDHMGCRSLRGWHRNHLDRRDRRIRGLEEDQKANKEEEVHQ